jgi:hypothetical protein
MHLRTINFEISGDKDEENHNFATKYTRRERQYCSFSFICEIKIYVFKFSHPFFVASIPVFNPLLERSRISYAFFVLAFKRKKKKERTIS